MAVYSIILCTWIKEDQRIQTGQNELGMDPMWVVSGRSSWMISMKRGTRKLFCGITDQYKEVFPEIQGMATDAVLEFGKKAHKPFVEKAIPRLRKQGGNNHRITKKEVTAVFEEIQDEELMAPPDKEEPEEITTKEESTAITEEKKTIANGDEPMVKPAPPKARLKGL